MSEASSRNCLDELASCFQTSQSLQVASFNQHTIHDCLNCSHSLTSQTQPSSDVIKINKSRDHFVDVEAQENCWEISRAIRSCGVTEDCLCAASHHFAERHRVVRYFGHDDDDVTEYGDYNFNADDDEQDDDSTSCIRARKDCLSVRLLIQLPVYAYDTFLPSSVQCATTHSRCSAKLVKKRNGETNAWPLTGDTCCSTCPNNC